MDAAGLIDQRRRLLLLKRAVLTARSSLMDFAKFMRPDIADEGDVTRSTYLAAPHLELTAQKLELLEAGDIKRLVLSMPPRHGKTELAQRTFIPWAMGRNPGWSVISATYNSTFAEDHGRAVRTLLQDPRYQMVFPGIRLQDGAQSVSRLETEDGSAANFVGRGGALTGRGGHLIVVDDPIKDRIEADSPNLRNSLWAWWTQVLSTRLMTDEGRMLIIMTRWHDDDIVGRLTDPANSHYVASEARKWTVINLPALAEANDPLGRKEGEPLWPQRFSSTYLASLRNQDARGFSALYQGRPAPDDGIFFSVNDIVEYSRMTDFPKNATMFGASDHAVSVNQWADKSAFIVFGVDENDDIWVHPDTVLQKLDAEETVNRMLALIRKHRPTFWYAEHGHITKSIGPFLRKRMVEERLYMAIVEMAPSKEKTTRAQSIKGRMSMRKVHFPSWAPWWEEARHQILTFPAGSKDDFVDALSMIGLGLATHHRPQAAAPRKTVMPGTLGALKEQSRRAGLREQLSRSQRGW